MQATNFLSPAQITDFTIETGIKKTSVPAMQSLLLGVLAGAFIAFAAEGSNMAAFNLLARPETYGLGKALAGAIFPTGLILTLEAGAELFTGNTMIFAAVLEGKVRLGAMLRNWGLVYVGNLLGSLLVAVLIVYSGQLNSGANLLGGITLKIASYKTHLEFLPALYLGILCNWLVCLAVWMSYGAKDIAGKSLAIFFPIWLFITSGFEHSVANMYYIPAAIMAKSNAAWVAASGLNPAQLEQINWLSFLGNLLPVTLGNIIGGSLFVAGAYWLAYKKLNASA